MRLMFASLAALAVVGLAAPSFAQDATPTPATPAPPAAMPAKTTAKPKVGTAAYCNTLKSTSAKSACLKRVASAHKTPTTPHKATKLQAPKDTSAMAPAEPKTTAAAAPPSPPQTITVPPLPQKTI